MFTWLLHLFPSLNFSTFILINTIVILINATTILAIKYKRGNPARAKEKSAAKRKSKGKSKKSSQRIKKRSPQKSKTVDQPQKTADQRGRSKNLKNDGDESINTTLDEITWMSSNADEAEAACRESKFYAGGQRQLRSPQLKSRKNHPDSYNSGSNKAIHHSNLHTIGEECDFGNPQQPFPNVDENQGQAFHSSPPTGGGPPRAQNPPAQNSERQASPVKKAPTQTDKVSAANDPSSQNAKRNRTQGDHCERSNQSPKEKPPTPKSAQSSGWSSNLSNTKCDLCAAEYQSFSSEHQIGSNKSELSTNLNRDSWIWFSAQCPTNAGNFAARQDTFRSTDPRVPELLAEITRQDQMNEDIQREAKSLIVSEPSKLVPHETKEIYDAYSSDKPLPACPIIKRTGIMYNDKTQKRAESSEGTKHKDVSTEHTKRTSDRPSPSSRSSPQLERGSDVKADKYNQDGSDNVIPAFRPRVQFVSQKPRRQSSSEIRRKVKDISPPNFSSIVYNHHKQPSPKSPRTSKISQGCDFSSRHDVFIPIERHVDCQKSDSNYFIKPSASCIFQLMPKHKSPKRHENGSRGSRRNSPDAHHTSSLKRHEIYDAAREYFQKNNDHMSPSQHVHEKHCPSEYYSTVQSREESESDSLFIMSTSLETFGDRTNQIGQEVSRTIKNIIFNNDSHSSTSNSKLGSSLQSRNPQRTADDQIIPVSPSHQERKRIATQLQSPRYKNSKFDRRAVITKNQSPPSKPSRGDGMAVAADRLHRRSISPFQERQQRNKYVFGSSYYLSTRSQSQLKLCSSKSCTSDESFSRHSRYDQRTQGSKSAPFGPPTQRAKIRKTIYN